MHNTCMCEYYKEFNYCALLSSFVNVFVLLVPFSLSYFYCSVNSLAKAWTQIVIQRMITCFKTDALLSFNSRTVNMSNQNRRSSSLTTASVASSWVLMVSLTKCCDNNFINMSSCRKYMKATLLTSNTHLSSTDGSCPLLGIGIEIVFSVRLCHCTQSTTSATSSESFACKL